MNTPRRILLALYGLLSLACWIGMVTDNSDPVFNHHNTRPENFLHLWIGLTILSACLYFTFAKRHET